jgi:hypothetical protein
MVLLPGWDEDSLEIEIVTRPSRDATGTYTVAFQIKNFQDNVTIFDGSLIEWNVIANNSASLFISEVVQSYCYIFKRLAI